MTDFPVVAFGVSAALYAAFALMVLVTSTRRAVTLALAVASVASALWLAAGAAYYRDTGVGLDLLHVLEVLRVLAWVAVMGVLLRITPSFRRASTLAVVLAAVGVLALILIAGWVAPGNRFDLAPRVELSALLTLAVLALASVEQVYRNTHVDDRWAIKYLCFGVGVIFAFDVYLYAEAALFRRVNADAWLARGPVNALAVPLLVLAARRNPNWDVRLFVSRHVVFHGATLFAAGIYLLAMSLAGYYLKTAGGTWGGAVRVVFLAGGLIFGLALVFSAQLRAEARHFLARHFYQNKYDYAEQWLKFTDRMADSDGDPASVGQSMIRSIADIVDATGSILYEVRGRGTLEEITDWNLDYQETRVVEVSDEVLERLYAEQLVLLDGDPYVPPEKLPKALCALPRSWVMVPMLHGGRLIGVIVLGQSRARVELGEEDRALLVTVGKQAAGILALVRANERLAEARQFDAFNRLSAFVVHDIKNVVAQLALIEKNAARFRDNPEFVDDAFNTVSSAVDRMNRLLASLRKASVAESSPVTFDVAPVTRKAVAARAHQDPRPGVVADDLEAWVEGDPERLGMVIEHLVTNAQEATAADGRVEVALARDGASVRISVSDTGCGMTPEFIAERLFKPFDTTKGNAGMGIGVYEARHVIEEFGGTLEVESEPGVGTRFEIVLPAAETTGPALIEASAAGGA